MSSSRGIAASQVQIITRAADRAAAVVGRRRAPARAIVEAVERRVLLNGGTVSGFVFNDADGNGVQTGSEQGLAGRVIYADLNNNNVLDNGEPYTTTVGSNGAYTLGNVPVGAEVIRQVLPGGWRETVPAGAGGQHVTVSGNALTANVDFAASTSAYVSGSVTNVSGASTAGEELYLDANNNSVVDAGEQTTTVTGSGTYSFTGVTPGTYIVRQVLPAGLVQTSPASNYGIHVSLASGQVFTGENFTDKQYSDVQGFVTANGSGLSGVAVYLDANGDAKLDGSELSTTTGAAGAYLFQNVPNGNYTVRQIVPAGDTQTVPGSGGYAVSVTNAGTFFNENFTDVLPVGATLSGTVTSGGTPVSGETVYLDANNDSKLDNNELSTTTLANGSYSFTGVPAGATIVRQILASRVTQTNPSGGLGIHVTVASGQNLTNENFTDSVQTVPPPSTGKLTGAVIGTAGSYNNSGNTGAKAFDGNLSTYFDAPTASGAWTGLDLGTGKIIMSISYAPRSGWASRMVGGMFQGSDTPDFAEGAVTLYTVTATPATGALTNVSVSSMQTFRYVRYLGPTGGYCDIAEVQFTGYAPVSGVTQNGNVLTVNGTNGNDTIDIDASLGDSTVITINGVSRTIPGEVVDLSLVVNALGGDDTVTYSASDNEFYGGTTIAGGDGSDSISMTYLDDATIYGGTGNDTIKVVDPVDTLNISDGDGNDSVFVTDPDHDAIGSTAAPSVTVGDGSDTIDASGLSGAFVNAGAGSDTIGISDSGEVTVNAGKGSDSISLSDDGGSGYSFAPDLNVLVGSGNDSIDIDNVYLSGSVSVVAGNGNDSIFLGEDGILSFATVTAGDGNDTIVAEADDGVSITAGNGNDNIFTGTYVGQYQLDNDDDPENATIIVGSGTDTINGFANAATVTGGSGNDSITLSATQLYIDGGAGNDTLTGSGNGDGHITLLGGAGNDVLRHVEPNDGGMNDSVDVSLNGGNGNDTIYANNGGPDSIDGGTGTDTAYIDAPNGFDTDVVTNVENVYQVPANLTPLAGTYIGTAGSYKNDGNVGTKAFDGNLANYFDAPTASGSWVGLDLGSAKTITQVAYAPRVGYASRMIGGMFQASNTADFSSGVVTLYTVTAAPAQEALTTVSVNASGTYRYVRYIGPANAYCDVAEVEFLGS